jgi:steroid delta-isomerase-like uncharacterized protein
VSADVTLKSYLDAFNRSDPAALAALYAPATAYYNPFSPEPLTSPEQVLAFESPMFAAFADTTATPDEVVAEGSRIAARVTVRARHSGALETPGGRLEATGKTIVLRTAEFMRVDDGRILEHHRYFDAASFLSQLDVH